MGEAEGDGSLHENNSGCRAKAGVMLRRSPQLNHSNSQFATAHCKNVMRWSAGEYRTSIWGFMSNNMLSGLG